MADFEKVNRPPVIESFTADPTFGNAPLTVTLTCNAHDPDGEIASYMWDFDGDGTIDSVTSSGYATHTYNSAGVFHPVVKVKGDQGVIISSKPITISVTNESITKANLFIDNASAGVGTVVDIPIEVDNNTSVIALQFHIKFNSNYLTVYNPNKPVIARRILTDAGFTVNSVVINPGDVLVIIAPPVKTPIPLIPNGKIATLSLSIKPNAQEGKETLDVGKIDASDANSNSIAINVHPGYLVIAKFLPGDTNGDGKINVQDVVAVINDIMIGDNSPHNGSDCNGDGIVNVQDYVCIVNKILSNE